ncbi:uncharacterized protein BKCO1_8000115 [Diplodia corticola]|uniref:Uncharacterized protein n=1 Tax=Diplodia corticola TaxID=236234 RepID=A0A1J9RX29_9PEZI|nr:uncharacterized protein BKCO1_8000115 [Diplodia corticola]OJD37195.1 hypothetical protein BKCO1_8000115 [Diplodia corticola]
MSSSIAIPKRRKCSGAGNNADSPESSSSLSSSVLGHTPVTSPSTPAPAHLHHHHHQYRLERRQSLLTHRSVTPQTTRRSDGRRLRDKEAQQAYKARAGSSISKSEHTVINVGHPDAPRLITCVRSSQGFDWNQDIFLPSYADYESSELERRQDPVQDIVLTDEEVASMFPSS